MLVYFSTVIRNAPAAKGGHLYALDWDAKRIVGSVPIAATNPTLVDPNPRGNTRGGRGIALMGDAVIVCSFHTLNVYDRGLAPVRTITNGLFVGLHEVCPTDRGTLWVTSTAIDAAFEIDLERGAVVSEFWPREMPALQRDLGLVPLAIDKTADNRGRFLASEVTSHPSHVHLNAVARFESRTYAFFNTFGAIVDLDQARVVVRDPTLRGAHNLLVDANGLAAINDSLGQRIVYYDLTTGAARGILDLRQAPWVHRTRRRTRLSQRLKAALHRRGLIALKPPRPLFMRGLDRVDGHLFVGISPATILRIDERSGDVVDLHQQSRNVSVCVHGLKALGG